MATISHNTTILTPQMPGDAVLTALAGRLRSHARSINNAQAKRTLGADLIRAADVIDNLMQGRTNDARQAAAAVAWLGRRGYAAFDGGRA